MPKSESLAALFPFVNVLVGHWKRNLEHIEFGGNFQLSSHSNTVVEVVLLDEDITNEKLTLQWSFGRSLTVDVAYRMEVFRDPETAAELFEFLWDKQKCFGRYHPASKSAVFNLNLRDGLVVIIYRIVSNNVLAVTITDTRSLDGNIPTVQVGLMNRIQKELYE